jgi:hypothetical protein
MPPNSPLQSAIRRGHEGNDIREGWVMFTAIALAVTLPVVLIFLWLQFRSLAGRRYQGLTRPPIQAAESIPTKVFPEPRLQTVSGKQFEEYLTKEQRNLNSYGWIDTSRQFVRIPIGRAMELIAERGLPVRGTNVNNAGPSELDLVRQRSQDQHLAPIKEVK